MGKEKEELMKISSFFQSNFEKKLVEVEGFLCGPDNVESFYSGLKKCT